MDLSLLVKIYSTKHMQYGLTITRLEAQLAEHLAFLDRFRSSLKQEEHGSQQ